MLVNRFNNHPHYEESDREVYPDWFKGFHVINRDTPINGGAFLSEEPREATVVDDQRYGPDYDGIYSNLVNEIYRTVEENPFGSVIDKVLVPTLTVVKRLLPYNPAVSNIAGAMHDQAVNLGVFLRAGGGIFRHQTLMAGYLLERLKFDGELMASDEISIDRRIVPRKGGHTWVRFTSSNATPYVFDPSRLRVDLMSELQAPHWDYRRPEEV